jgi:hypothetical protein
LASFITEVAVDPLSVLIDSVNGTLEEPASFEDVVKLISEDALPMRVTL